MGSRLQERLAVRGGKERQEHLQLIRGGAEGFAVGVDFNHKDKITGFDDQTLLRLGSIVAEGKFTYGKITGKLAVENLSKSTSPMAREAADIEDLCSSDIPLTKRKVFIEARIGQGKFRDDVLSKWNHKCAVTGVSVISAIRASHIKPWKDSNPSEKLNPDNGLPLVATLDALFDAGLITFVPTGQIELSSLLSENDIENLRLDKLCLVEKPSKQTIKFIAFHSKHVFRP